jgi:hypothetical protein
MIEIGPMGPGFFIFFRFEEPEGGAGYPFQPVIFIEGAEKKLKKQVRRKVKKIQKQERIVSKEAIKKITDELIGEVDLQPTIDQYQLEYDEALIRFRIYIEWTIQLIEDEELALILIFANI